MEVRKGIAILALALGLFSQAGAVELRVSVNGSANSDCSECSPCTLQRAAELVNPGDVVLVADGVYTNGTSHVLTIGRGGTAGNKVTFKSVNKWGAKLSGAAGGKKGVQVSASYVRVEGFDISGFEGDDVLGVHNSSGQFFELVGNHIHHIGRNTCTNDTNGLDGYFSQGMNDILIDSNQFDNIGRLGCGHSGCNLVPNSTCPDSTKNQLDQAVYMTGNRVTISNNIFYNILSGWPIQIYMNEGTLSDDFLIVNNTFAGYGQHTNVGQIIIYDPVTDLTISNNIFHQTKTNIVKTNQSGMTGTVANNISDIAITNIFDTPNAGMVASGNLWSTNPLFASISIAGGIVSGTPDFHIASGPAINAGLTLTGVTRDFDGVSRPQGIAFDIGAYELP